MGLDTATKIFYENLGAVTLLRSPLINPASNSSIDAAVIEHAAKMYEKLAATPVSMDQAGLSQDKQYPTSKVIWVLELLGKVRGDGVVAITSKGNPFCYFARESKLPK